MSQLSSTKKSILLAALVIFGSLAIITFNLQNSQIVFVDKEDTYGVFNHPFMQTFSMFVAEFLCLLAFFYVKTTKSYKSQYEEACDNGIQRIKILLILIPTCCDSIGALCIYISLNFLPPSVNSILTCGIIATSAILSRLMLKRRYTTKEIQGCALVLVGVAIVGISGFAFPEEQKQEDIKKQIISIFLMLFSIFLYGFQYTIEERFYKTYFIHPLELIGFEGMWGLIIYTFICISLTFTKCPEVLYNVCIPYDGEFYFERADYYFQQFSQSALLQFAVIFGILSISVYNTMCQTVTKYLSCVTRALVDVAKIMMIWIISLIISLSTSSSNYHWENVRLGAIIIEVVGFSFVVAGEIIYNFNATQVEGTDELTENLSLQKG
ncbi:unnamed protein product [Paramecium octaurelia]|uniref:EamA domain-containing protein n=1 Tax=Paramecium octaurelia TaxID=43137 RepID=A0A8S1S2Z6_PAROT|nr:unnamed protein product [Paramecium octaurelia]